MNVFHGKEMHWRRKLPYLQRAQMKTILIFVTTLDGKVTQWGNPNVSAWSSQQDQEYFKKILDEASLVVMGSNTYKADTFHPSAQRRFIILTSHPDQYKDLEITGQLEFTNESPMDLTARCNREGQQQMLVVGGPHVATSFLKDQLIDELWLTIEPRIFGTGGNFATGENLDISLRLLHVEQVNEQGTLISRYLVDKQV
jgi:dihydrofolate reductase